jgi:cytoskeletal protein RodZ
MSPKRLKASRYRHDRNRSQAHILKENEPMMNGVEEQTIEEIKESTRLEPELADISSDIDTSGPKLGDILPELKKMNKEIESNNNQEKEVTEVASENVLKAEKQEEPVADTKDELPEETVPEAAPAVESFETKKVENEPERAEEPKTENSNADDPDRVPVSTTYSDDEVPNRPGAILMHAREILGLSQREVAHKLNLRVNSVSDIEHDRLNQLTAVQFASVHIANYAKLVNINPELLVDLYKQNVRANVQLQEEQKAKAAAGAAKTEKKKNLKVPLMIAGAAVLVVATAAITSSLMSKSDSNTSGALVIEDTVEASVDSEGTLLMDTENSKMKTNVVEEEPLTEPVDMNTLMAQEQSKNLNTDEIIDSKAGTQTTVEKTNTNISLKVKGEAAKKLQAAKVEPIDENVVQEASSTLKSVNLNSADTVKTVKSEENKLKVSNDNVLTSAKVNDTAAVLTAQPKAETPKVETPKTEPAEKPVSKATLSANTRDVSSSVRLNGKRDPFESMNTATIKVTGDVAIKVTGNGKLLKQGNFSSGDTIKVTGIPPLKISVSDSSKVRISYMGTTVAVPGAQQVSFALPTR